MKGRGRLAWFGAVLVAASLAVPDGVRAQPYGPPPYAPPSGAPPSGGPPPRPELGRPEWGTPGPMMPDMPGAPMPNADPFQLLTNSPEVQADLGLTQMQLAQIQRAARNFRTGMQEMSYPRPGDTPEQMRARVERHGMEARGMIARELTPPQLHRLQQIMLQLEGPCLATRDPELARHIGLGPDKLRAIGEACQRRAGEMRTAFQPPPAGPEFCRVMLGNRDRIEGIRARSDARILGLMSPRERASFEQAAGRKISLEPPMPPECH